MSSVNAPTPIHIHIPHSLAHLAIPLSTYLEKNPSFTNLAVGACIFAHTADEPSGSSRPHLLLVQRSATERSFPHLWEVPGGSAETGDLTILHSLAREVFEETGLRLTKFVRTIGDGIQSNTGKHQNWIKLTFQIEVQEDVSGAVANTAGENDIVDLDPAEHQAFTWVTEEELKRWVPGMIVTEEQRQLMLQAFDAHHNGV